MEPDNTLRLEGNLEREHFSGRVIRSFEHPRIRDRSACPVYTVKSVQFLGCEGSILEEIYSGPEGGGSSFIEHPIPILIEDVSIYLERQPTWFGSPQNQLVIVLESSRRGSYGRVVVELEVPAWDQPLFVGEYDV